METSKLKFRTEKPEWLSVLGAILWLMVFMVFFITVAPFYFLLKDDS